MSASYQVKKYQHLYRPGTIYARAALIYEGIAFITDFDFFLFTNFVRFGIFLSLSGCLPPLNPFYVLRLFLFDLMSVYMCC